MKVAKCIGPSIWWAYKKTKRADGGHDFEGDIFSGPNAESLAVAFLDKLEKLT